MYSDFFESVYEKWKGTGLLDGLDDYKAHHMAMLLDNQLTYKGFDYEKNNKRKMLWERIQLPLVRRVFSDLLLWEMISIQAMSAPLSAIYNRDKYGNLKEQDIKAKAKNIGSYIPLVDVVEGEGEDALFAKWKDDFFAEGEYAGSIIQEESLTPTGYEVTLLEYVSNEIINEITREVFTDLRNNISYSTKEWKSPTKLIDSILYEAETTTRKIGRSANWLVTSPEIVIEMVKSGSFTPVPNYKANPKKIQRVGNLSKINVYVDPKFFTDEILMGYKGDPYAASYFYCPFIPLVEILGLDKVGRYRLMTRVGKNMIGDDYYSGIVFQNYSYINNEGNAVVVEEEAERGLSCTS